MRFEKIPLEGETELESLIIRNMDVIEEGLKLISHQVRTGAGIIDILCSDADNRLTVIELKAKESDRVLLQALTYHDWVNENALAIKEMFSKARDVDVNKSPRLILVAPRFSEDLMKAVKYIEPQIDLVEWAYLKSPSGEKGLYCRPVEVEELERIADPPTIQDHINYIIDEDLRTLFKNTIERIKSIGKGIEVTPTKFRLAFKYRGRNFAILRRRRNFFRIETKSESGEWERSDDIETQKDLALEFFNRIKEAYARVGGKLAEAESTENPKAREMEPSRSKEL